MAMNMPFMGGPFSQASAAVTNTARMVMGEKTPKWFGPAIIVASLGALALDGATYFNMKHMHKDVDAEELAIERRLKLYDDRLAQLNAPAPAPVNVTVNVGSAPGTQTSRYMMEEGNADLATDCFACAGGHLAGMEGSFDQALKHMDGDTCGEGCQSWLNDVAQEAAGLLEKDWTDEKIAAQPEEKRRILEKYRPRVQGVLTDVLNGNEQAELINRGSAMLDESLRFTNAGDSIDNPDVADRLRTAMNRFAPAERHDITTFDVDTANKLRAVRQATGSKINTVDDLKQVRTQGREVASAVNRKEFSRLDKDKIVELAREAKGIHWGFSSDRSKVG